MRVEVGKGKQRGCVMDGVASPAVNLQRLCGCPASQVSNELLRDP